MNAPAPSRLTRVYLVGSGPGDPGMITLQAIQCLSGADVILYDYLVNPQILCAVRIFTSFNLSVVFSMHGHPFAGDDAGRQPEPSAKEVTDGRM